MGMEQPSCILPIFVASTNLVVHKRPGLVGIVLECNSKGCLAGHMDTWQVLGMVGMDGLHRESRFRLVVGALSRNPCLVLYTTRVAVLQPPVPVPILPLVVE